MDLPENVARRQALKRHPLVEGAIQRFWEAFDKNDNYQVSKDSYISFLVRVCKLVIPEFDLAEALETAKADWTKDSKGAESLSYVNFVDAFFELADIWCPEIDAEEYAEFLDALRIRLQVKRVRTRGGTEKVLRVSTLHP